MTGFGRGNAAGETFNATIELKTVNNRFLDVNMRLSAETQPFESLLKKLITERLSRGRVDVFIQLEKTSDVSYELNRPLISGYLAAVRELTTEFDLKGEADLSLIARLPGAIQPSLSNDDEAIAAGLKNALSSALDDLEAMRIREGQALAEDLGSMIEAIEGEMPRIESEASGVTVEYQEKLETRITNLLAKTGSDIEIDPGRLAQEVAYLADKSDISEEISRLRGHCDHFREIMAEEGVVGKRLDFLTQELNREANTIASKTQNMTIKEAALRMKAEIEKIREQVQNVE